MSCVLTQARDLYLATRDMYSLMYIRDSIKELAQMERDLISSSADSDNDKAEGTHVDTPKAPVETPSRSLFLGTKAPNAKEPAVEAPVVETPRTVEHSRLEKSVDTLENAAANIAPPVPDTSEVPFAVAHLDNDPSMAKMNDIYYRNKGTGKVVVAGALGSMWKRSASSHEGFSRPVTETITASEKPPEQESAEEITKAPVSLAGSIPALKSENIPAINIEQELEAIHAQQAEFENTLVREEQGRFDAKTSTDNIVMQSSNPSINERFRPAVSSVVESSRPTSASVEVSIHGAGAESIEDYTRPSIQRVEKEISPDVQTMPMSELLKVADTIGTGYGSLKELFESNKIDAVNLRRIVSEHSSGGNVENMIGAALDAREMRNELRSEVKKGSFSQFGGGSGSSGPGPGADDDGVSGGGTPASRAPQVDTRPDRLPNIVQAGMAGADLGRARTYDSSSSNVQDDDKFSVPMSVIVVLGMSIGVAFAALMLVLL